MNQQHEKLWSIPEAANALKFSDATLRRLKNSEGVAFRRISGRIKIRNSALTDWLGFDLSVEQVHTIPEVALHSGLSVPTIERAIRDSKLKSFKIGRSRRITHSDLCEFLGFEPGEFLGCSEFSLKSAPSPPSPDSPMRRSAAQLDRAIANFLSWLGYKQGQGNLKTHKRRTAA